MYGNNGHPHSLNSPAHKGGAMAKRSPPHSTCTMTHAIAVPPTSHRRIEPCGQHKHGGNERDGAHPSAYRSPSLLPSPAGWRPTLTNEARRTPSAPSECTQQAGAQSPSCHRKGEHKQSSSRTISASSGEEYEIRACQKHSQQRDNKRDTVTQGDSGHGNYRNKPQGF
ncbi:hypothetical protein TcCL_ESM09868 [Trypanosoma cruzi]|nr:hypothetical protein TcCL_ESM09868 [Trypanosoma cruzi]